MPEEPIRVLVVDDTAIYRKIVSELLAEIPDVEVVGRASHGEMALQQIQTLCPHIVTLDVEMPVMDGLEVLRQLQKSSSKVGVIMLSARTAHSAAATVTALELGALDFVLKPNGTSITDNISELRESLASRVRSLGRIQRIRNMLGSVRQGETAMGSSAGSRTAGPLASGAAAAPPRPPRRGICLPQIVAIGISTGGPQALQRLVPRLPADLPVPVVIVQHMPPVFTRSLADDLNKRSQVRVCEGADGQAILAGNVYIAPGGQQMKIAKIDGAPHVVITADPPENSCRPSVDYLFRSVASHYGGNTLAVIMTGMGSDGAAECRKIRQLGGTIFAQDEASCVVFGMPRQPVEEGLTDFTGSPEQLAAEITQLVRRGELVCR